MFGYFRSLAARLPPIRRLIDQRDAAQSRVAEAEARASQADTNVARLTVLLEQKAPPQPTRNEYDKSCFSHWGEDQILGFLFKEAPPGRYLDIGCYHPELMSNTKLLNSMGWSGVNIDPNPFMIDLFKEKRPDDVNLCQAVAEARQELDFFFFSDWASSNTLSETFADRISTGQNVPIKKRMKVQALPLSEIMEAYFADEAPDFMNIDVEDLDSAVLSSNDWKKFRPKVIAVEDIDCSLASAEETIVVTTLRDNGYIFFSRTIYTNFFIDREFNKKYWGFK